MATTPHSEPLLMDINAAATFIGIGPGVLRRWVSDGLPFVRAGRGGRKLFTRRDLERFVERRKESAGA
jgi:predicted site-specific integrase-resolvase